VNVGVKHCQLKALWYAMQWAIILRLYSRDKLMYGVPIDRTQMLAVSSVICDDASRPN